MGSIVTTTYQSMRCTLRPLNALVGRLGQALRAYRLRSGTDQHTCSVILTSRCTSTLCETRPRPFACPTFLIAGTSDTFVPCQIYRGVVNYPIDRGVG